jgi:hypothetical protein
VWSAIPLYLRLCRSTPVWCSASVRGSALMSGVVAVSAAVSGLDHWTALRHECERGDVGGLDDAEVPSVEGGYAVYAEAFGHRDDRGVDPAE